MATMTTDRSGSGGFQAVLDDRNGGFEIGPALDGKEGSRLGDL